MQAKYTALIEYVKEQRGSIDVVPTPDRHVAVVGNAYSSDSLLFWTEYSKMA